MPRRNNQIEYKRPEQPSCNHKRQYDTETEAQKAARYQTLINHGMPLSVYRCEKCQKWHLTRMVR